MTTLKDWCNSLLYRDQQKYHEQQQQEEMLIQSPVTDDLMNSIPTLNDDDNSNTTENTTENTNGNANETENPIINDIEDEITSEKANQTEILMFSDVVSDSDKYKDFFFKIENYPMVADEQCPLYMSVFGRVRRGIDRYGLVCLICACTIQYIPRATTIFQHNTVQYHMRFVFSNLIV